MESTPHKKTTTHNQEHLRLSKSNLLSSSKVVIDAAKAALHHETDKIDKGKAVGATVDLLGAAIAMAMADSVIVSTGEESRDGEINVLGKFGS